MITEGKRLIDTRQVEAIVCMATGSGITNPLLKEVGEPDSGNIR